MNKLVYKIIKSDKQYHQYCATLESLVMLKKKTKSIEDEIELLTLLIEKYELETNTFEEIDPIELLKGLMKEHQLKAVDLSRLLNVSEGLVSDMLHYKKGLSKDSIRILSDRFKLNQSAFNRPYTLEIEKPKGSNSLKPSKTAKSLKKGLSHLN